jgi:hypothetical protein
MVPMVMRSSSWLGRLGGGLTGNDRREPASMTPHSVRFVARWAQMVDTSPRWSYRRSTE